MSNKARSYKKIYKVTFTGYSRGWPNEPTFQEGTLSTYVQFFTDAFKKFYKTAKVKIEEIYE